MGKTKIRIVVESKNQKDVFQIYTEMDIILHFLPKKYKARIIFIINGSDKSREYMQAIRGKDKRVGFLVKRKWRWFKRKDTR